MPADEKASKAPAAQPPPLRIRCLDPLSRGCTTVVLVPFGALAAGPRGLAASIKGTGGLVTIGQFSTNPADRCLDVTCGPCTEAWQAASDAHDRGLTSAQVSAAKAGNPPKPADPPVPDIGAMIRRRG